MKKYLLSLSLSICLSICAYGVNNVRFHNEDSDTTRINSILIDAASQRFANPSERVGYIARKFVDVPYVAGTLEQTPEMVTVNLDEMDCTTFVETVLAMAYTIGEGRTSWRDFVYNLERLRYRGGEAKDYASRLHYNSDWVVDNVHRGNIEDASRIFPRINYVERSLCFMTDNRDKYPALADDEQYLKIKTIEQGYCRHRFPYVKTADLTLKENKNAFRDGDAVALVTNIKTLDVSHMGFIVKVEGELYLLHASSREGKVVISQRPLLETMKRNRSAIGLRVFRLKD